MFKDCHLSDGQQVDDIDVDITTNVTAAETVALHNALHALDAWAVVRQAGTTQCATPAAGELTAVGSTRFVAGPA